MITKVVFKNFKRLKDSTFEFKPKELSLLVGGNNSGKSSILEGLATWEFCKNVIVYEKGPHALVDYHHAAGFGITIDEFTSISIPSFRYLWTNLRSQGGYTLSINCYWKDKSEEEKFLEIGMALTQERLYIKVVSSNLTYEDKVPQVAYLPTFAGISPKEQWLSKAMRDMLIGRGQTGAVIRNQIIDLYELHLSNKSKRKGEKKKLGKGDYEWLNQNDPYTLLNRVLVEVFQGQISPRPFNPERHTFVSVDFYKGTLRGNRFFPFKKYNKRDIMVEGKGFLQWLSVYTFVVTPDIDVVLLDEPDAHLHCSLQTVLLEHLQELHGHFNKQILLATHSTEVIKSIEPEIIYSVDRHMYLKDDDTKIALLAGLGTEYFPLMNMLGKSHKVLFVENKSDAKILRTFCEKYSEWPKDVAVWPTTLSQSDRKVLFVTLTQQYSGLKALSLRDRDNELYSTTSESLLDGVMQRDYLKDTSELRFRKWRRWEIESYLISPKAIIRLIMKKQPELSAGECETQFGNFIHDNFSIVLQEPYLYQSDRVPQNTPLFDLDAKTIINSICKHFCITKYDILKEIATDEIPTDVKTMVDEICDFFK